MFFFCVVVVEGSYVKVMGECIAHRCRIGTTYSERLTLTDSHTNRHKTHLD